MQDMKDEFNKDTEILKRKINKKKENKQQQILEVTMKGKRNTFLGGWEEEV
jgi:hypothetical protein